MHDAVQDFAIPNARRGCSEDTTAQSGAVERPAPLFLLIWGRHGGGRCWKKQIWSCGGKVFDDGVVGVGSWADGLAGQEIGINER